MFLLTYLLRLESNGVGAGKRWTLQCITAVEGRAGRRPRVSTQARDWLRAPSRQGRCRRPTADERGGDSRSSRPTAPCVSAG